MEIDEENQEDEEINESELQITRFIDNLFNYLLKGISSSDKNVRLRVCQLMALSLDSLTEMDDDMYCQLIDNLRERAMEKDSSIRVHAAIALSRLIVKFLR